MGTSGPGTATTGGAQVGLKRNAFIGSCKHHIWQAIRASSAAPYYLDDYSDGSLSFVLALLSGPFCNLFYRIISLKLLFSVICTDVYRWQDGAIVANNPTIFAMQEAKLLWPDARIDCLVSIGCGSVPTKVNANFVFSGREFHKILVIWSCLDYIQDLKLLQKTSMSLWELGNP